MDKKMGNDMETRVWDLKGLYGMSSLGPRVWVVVSGLEFGVYCLGLRVLDLGLALRFQGTASNVRTAECFNA